MLGSASAILRLVGWLESYGPWKDFGPDKAFGKGIRPVAVPTRNYFVSPGKRKMLVTTGATFGVL
jgi:hypothetical protein